jgi:prepilin-type processing-associated H-X9-DG protein
MGCIGRSRTLGGSGFTTRFSPNDYRDYPCRLCPVIEGIPHNCNLIGAANDNTHCTVMILTARSRHTGGVNASLIDGSVRFISNTINLDIWRAISTSDGSESINF